MFQMLQPKVDFFEYDVSRPVSPPNAPNIVSPSGPSSCMVCGNLIDSDSDKTRQKLFGDISSEALVTLFSTIFQISPKIYTQNGTDLKILSTSLCCSACTTTISDCVKISRQLKGLENGLNRLKIKLQNDMVRSYHGLSDGASVEEDPFSPENMAKSQVRATFVQFLNKSCESRSTLPSTSTSTQILQSENKNDGSSLILQSKKSVKSKSKAVLPKPKSGMVYSKKDAPIKSVAVKELDPLQEQKENDQPARTEGPEAPNSSGRNKLVDSSVKYTDSYECPHCKKKYLDKDFVTPAGKLAIRCDLPDCSRQFSTFKAFSHHHETTCTLKLLKGNETNFECTHCGKKCLSERTLKDHEVSIHTKKFDIFCNLCGKGYGSKASLRSHVNFCHKGNTYQCHVCPQAYRSKTMLAIHLRRHNGELPFQCSVCEKRVVSFTKLKRHETIHAIPKFPCHICNKLFKSRDYVRYHIRSYHNKKLSSTPRSIRERSPEIMLDSKSTPLSPSI